MAEGVRSAVSDAPGVLASAARLTLDRREAERRLAEALRLYDLAPLVQQRAGVGSVDSAPLAHKAPNVLLGLLVGLDGGSSESGFDELVACAHAICRAESPATDEFGDDRTIVAEPWTRFADRRSEPSAADARRYDRAFSAVGRLLTSVQAHLDERIPAEPGRLFDLQPGMHPIRAEFFDDAGVALIILEWSSERLERRLIAREDLR